MTKITGLSLLTRLELMEGNKHTRHEWADIMTQLSELVNCELSKGNSVTLPKIGVIVPKIHEASVRNVAGEMRNVPEHITTKFNPSKFLKEEFVNNHSTQARQGAQMRGIGDKFLK